MESTGLVRRIDELGRIVIPKEIRNTLKIRDGENIEILVEKEKIILKKYLQTDNLVMYIKKIGAILEQTTHYGVAISDREKIIAAFGNNIKALENLEISQNIINVIDKREILICETQTEFEVAKYKKINSSFIVYPIIALSDCIGTIIIENNNYEKEMKTFAIFLSSVIASEIEI